MIKEHCFSEEWLKKFKEQKLHKRIDKNILEKMIYALHLLECLKQNELDFVFKGGTSLVLLLEGGNRFSIDIDIICNVSRSDLESILYKVIQSSNFKSFELDEKRSYKEGVPKAHYSFAFDSVMKGSYPGNILLDILIEDSLYPKLIEKPIQTKWVEVERDTYIKLPTIDGITGDKLTAFAPNTVGIPYYKGNKSFAMEICKQLFDLSHLFERIEDIRIVQQSFEAFAEREIKYRKAENLNLTSAKVLEDTISTCLIITKKGNKATSDEKKKFEDLKKGIKAFGTGFLMVGNFRVDDAVLAAARVAYLCTKLLYNDLSPIEYYNDQNVKNLLIENPEWNFLNPLKKQSNKSGFFYWYKAIEVRREIN